MLLVNAGDDRIHETLYELLKSYLSKQTSHYLCPLPNEASTPTLINEFLHQHSIKHIYVLAPNKGESWVKNRLQMLIEAAKARHLALVLIQLKCSDRGRWSDIVLDLPDEFDRFYKDLHQNS